MSGRVAFWPHSPRSLSRAAKLGAALLAVAVVVTACGMFRYEQREAWRGRAEQECLSRGDVRPSAVISEMAPINRGVCGMDRPLRVAAFAQGTVSLKARVVLGCPVVSTADRWLAEIVQPAADLYFGASVVEMKAGGYSCRTMNNQPGARMSEHSYGNAIDIMSFRLSDGREITVVRGWKGSRDEQEFLREVFVGACRYFGTVLGPGADMFHYDHFHVDLARHTPNGSRRICKPAIKFEPRIDPDRPATPIRIPPKLPPLQQPLAPSDDVDNDPFVSDDEMADASRARRNPAAAPTAAPVYAAPARPVPPTTPEPMVARAPDPYRAATAPQTGVIQVPRSPVQAGLYPQSGQGGPRPLPPAPMPGLPERPGYATQAQVQRLPTYGEVPAARPIDLTAPGAFSGVGLY